MKPIRRVRRAASLRALGGTVALWALAAAPAQAAPAQPDVNPRDAGDVAVLDMTTQRPLEGGDGNSSFVLQLPSDARCPGDSYHDQWRVQSFLIPASEKVEDIEWGGLGPKKNRDEGEIRWALYAVNTVPYVHGLLPKNTEPGEPGFMNSVPAFSFSVFDGDELPAGTYRVGLACTLWRELDVYWDTVLEIESGSQNGPAGFSWTVAAPTPAASADGSSNFAPVALAAVAGAAVSAHFVLRKRTHHRKPTDQLTEAQSP